MCVCSPWPSFLFFYPLLLSSLSLSPLALALALPLALYLCVDIYYRRMLRRLFELIFLVRLNLLARVNFLGEGLIACST